MRTGSALDEPEYLPLSYLSQAAYCLRRAALLLNERAWEENSDTAKGRAEHERVHAMRVERRGDALKLYEFSVFSDRLGLVGKCDCIEARKEMTGCRIPAADFPVTLYPVEYKHGVVRDEREYELQLCAEAMYLEEMFGASITEGAIFYITSHRRQAVPLTDTLREGVLHTAKDLRRIRDTFSVPAPVYGPKCKRCSLLSYCMPLAKASATAYCSALELAAKAVDEL